jgi:hypothetical protein
VAVAFQRIAQTLTQRVAEAAGVTPTIRIGE